MPAARKALTVAASSHHEFRSAPAEAFHQEQLSATYVVSMYNNFHRAKMGFGVLVTGKSNS
jgi:hypothetical protein